MKQNAGILRASRTENNQICLQMGEHEITVPLKEARKFADLLRATIMIAEGYEEGRFVTARA
jgi:hypothetical protein